MIKHYKTLDVITTKRDYSYSNVRVKLNEEALFITHNDDSPNSYTFNWRNVILFYGEVDHVKMREPLQWIELNSNMPNEGTI